MKRKILFLLLTLCFYTAPNFADAGFGVSPGKIIEDDLIPGSIFESTIYLVQGDPKESLTVEVFVTNDEIADWIIFEKGPKFQIPAGVQQYPLKLKVKIPENSSLGIFKTFLRVNVVPEEAKDDGQVNIALGGRIDITFIVGDNVVEEYEILSIDVLDINSNQDPAILVNIKNTGNVPTSPASASFELFDKFGVVRLGFASSENFKKIDPFKESTQKITFPIDIKLAPGEYWGSVVIYDDLGKKMGEMKTVFDVKKSSISLSLITYILIGLGAAVVLFFFIRRKKR